MGKNTWLIVVLVVGTGAAFMFKDKLMDLYNRKRYGPTDGIATEEDLSEDFVQDPSALSLSRRIDDALGKSKRAAYSSYYRRSINDRFSKLNKSRN